MSLKESDESILSVDCERDRIIDEADRNVIEKSGSYGLTERSWHHKFEFALYSNMKSKEGFSAETKRNFFVIYVLLLVHLGVNFSVTLFWYLDGVVPRALFMFHTVWILVLYTVGFVLLYVFKAKLYEYSNWLRFSYSMYYGMIMLYVCTVDLLHFILEENVMKTEYTTQYVLICYSYAFRLLLVNKFLSICLVSVMILVIRIGTFFLASHELLYMGFADHMISWCFIILQATIAYYKEQKITKVILIRLEEELKYDIQKRQQSKTNIPILTRSQRAIFHLDNALKKFKGSENTPLLRNNNSSLLTAVKEIENIKKAIANKSSSLITTSNNINSEEKTALLTFFSNAHGPTEDRERLPLKDIENKISTRSLSNVIDNQLAFYIYSIGNDWDLDIHNIKAYTARPILSVVKPLLRKWRILEGLKTSVNMSEGYFEELERLYSDLPFYNSVHAVNVLHNYLYFLNSSRLFGTLDTIEYLGILISCLGHDVGKYLFSDNLLLKTNSQDSVTYSNKNIMQNMSCSLIFSIANAPERNIFRNLSLSEWTRIRKLIIFIVLNLDSSKHHEIVSKFEIKASALNDTIPEDRKLLFSMGLKCADLGFLGKEYDAHHFWFQKLLEELYLYGDREREIGLVVSVFCDREKHKQIRPYLVLLSEVGLPMYEIWIAYLRSSNCLKIIDQIHFNISEWERKLFKRSILKGSVALF